MFAGPNGSGKSTIKTVLLPELVGVYVNPDDIQKDLAEAGSIDFSAFKVKTTAKELAAFFAKSTLLAAAQRELLNREATLRKSVLTVPTDSVDAYLASVLSDFIRRKLIAGAESFTFETVMSSPDKVQLLDEAKARGFRTYLYYIATDDPEINISRVQNRVGMGGHPVPKQKIVARYKRSLNLLFDAIRKTDRAYLFDNSSSEPVWLAEVTGGKELKLKTDAVPQWLKQSVLDKLPSGEDH